MKTLLVCLVILLLVIPHPASAGCYRNFIPYTPYVSYSPPVYTPTYVAPAVVVTPLTAVTTVVPAYGTAIVGGSVGVAPAAAPATSTTASAAGDLCQQRIEALEKRWDERLRLLTQSLTNGGTSGQGQGQGQQGGPNANINSAAQVFQSKCSKCHSEGVAVEKGKGFVLIKANGAMADIDLRHRLEILTRTSRGEADPKVMPPAHEKTPLSNEEYAAIQEYVANLK